MNTHSAMLPILLLSLVAFASAEHINIQLRENITQPCPGVKSELVDKNSIKFNFEMLGSDAGGDQVTVTDQLGQSRQVTFPGCYRVRMSFRLRKPLSNPYVEAFLQLGTNLPCRNEEGPASLAGNICTNVTRSSWCPKSQHSQLRSFLQDKSTCQFCHMCNTAKLEQGEELHKFVQDEGSDACRSDDGLTQHVSFKMCTPSKSEMNKKKAENEEKIDEYWNYLKQGVMTAVVHVLDRRELPASRLSQCRAMCNTYEGKRGVSANYKSTLLKSIEGLCAPKDEYAACIYHTMKFDVNRS